MAAFENISRKMVESLSLSYEPVGVTLYGANDDLPADVSFTERQFKSYCEALTLAGRGEAFLLRKEQMGCKLGTSVLGFEKDMFAYLDDGVLEKYGVGLFATEEASSETILKSTYLAKGTIQVAFIAPLSSFTQPPQVVVCTANSEQVMWLLYAVNYEKGGKMDLPQSGGALGGCADITALPLLEGTSNITFLGLGCRIKSAIEPGDLMMGIPGKDIEMLAHNIENMAKPIAMLNKSRKT